MQHIEFRTVQQEVGVSSAVPAIVPHLGGVSLIDLLRRVEPPSSRRDGKAGLAGSYAGLVDARVRWPSRHYLGEPLLTWSGGQDTVTWSSYRTGHRDRDCSDLRDFVFDRGQYEEEVRATAS